MLVSQETLTKTWSRNLYKNPFITETILLLIGAVMKRTALALTLILALLFSAVAGTLSVANVGSADSVVNDWSMFHYDATHSGSPDNIAPTTHDLLWTIDLLMDEDAFSIVGSSPAVVDGVVYFRTWYGMDYALNASTGEEIWNFSAGWSYSSPAVVNGVYYAR